MKFPKVPGKTPREQFENLARCIFSAPTKAAKRKVARSRTLSKKEITAGSHPP